MSHTRTDHQDGDPATPAGHDRGTAPSGWRALERRAETWPAAVLGGAGMLLFLGAWELAPRLGLASPRYLPPASQVIVALGGMLREPWYWRSVGDTLSGWAIGLTAAVVAATTTGLLIGVSPLLRRLTHSTIEFLRPIPSVALIPLAVLLFGVGMESKLMLICYASFWPVLIQILYGAADVDPVTSRTAKSFGLSRLQRVRHVVWPTVLPYLLTGLRLAAGVALILAVTAELVIGTPGIGRQIAASQAGAAYAHTYGLVVTAGLLGVLINSVFRALERHLLPWHPSIRRELWA